MKRRLTILALTIMTLVAPSVVWTVGFLVLAEGATSIMGVVYFADFNVGECVGDAEGNGSDFVFRMTGDLEGCYYVFIADYECSTSKTYRETKTEIFVKQYNKQTGTFATTYLFTAKLESCPDLATEIFGRCQHPIVRSSGIGAFEGVTGRFDIKDDIDAGTSPIRSLAVVSRLISRPSQISRSPRLVRSDPAYRAVLGLLPLMAGRSPECALVAATPFAKNRLRSSTRYRLLSGVGLHSVRLAEHATGIDKLSAADVAEGRLLAQGWLFRCVRASAGRFYALAVAARRDLRGAAGASEGGPSSPSLPAAVLA
jgi:hypothetical protein